VGSESLSEFWQALRLDQPVGSSASALRTLAQQMQQTIIADQRAQSSAGQPQSGSGIGVGGDATLLVRKFLQVIGAAIADNKHEQFV
jgi:hypothetical protein